MGFAAVGFVGVSLSLCQCFALRYVGCLQHVEDRLQADERSVQFCDREVTRRWRIIFFCLVFAFLRAACVSGLEAATVYILETKLDWSKDFTGLAVGVAFVAVVPIRYLYNVNLCQ